MELHKIQLNNNLKKLVGVILLLVTLFLIFLYVYLSPRSYKEEYKVDGFKIVEEYKEEDELYYFIINDKYEFIKDYSYSTKRKLITNIKSEDNCITPILDKDSFHEICLIEDGENSYQTINNLSSSIVKDKYEGINTYDYLDNIYVIWNYNNVLLISQNNKEKVELFNRDIYNNTLSVLVDDILLMPNYNKQYEYNEFIILDITNGKTTKWKIDYEISDDSYILGVLDDIVYLVDRKNKIEYKINPNKELIEIAGTNEKMGTIYLDDKFENITLNKLVYKKYAFTYKSIYNYEIINNVLYLVYYDSNIKTKIADFKDGKIININDDTIYYIIKSEVYMFSPSAGAIKLLENFEWNFNCDNMIFIYNK